MKKLSLYPFHKFIVFVLILSIGQSCGHQYGKVDQEFEVRTWGGWLLQEIIPQDSSSPVPTLNDEQYLERNYKGWTITGNAQTTEIDSVLLYRNRQLVFAGQVAEELGKNAEEQKIVYRLTNHKYYWVQLIPVEGSEDGTGNDQLLVSEFVDSQQDLAKTRVYRYVRTNLGKRPW